MKYEIWRDEEDGIHSKLNWDKDDIDLDEVAHFIAELESCKIRLLSFYHDRCKCDGKE
jgi:hypothetical protein